MDDDGVYHVLNRGNGRQRVFQKDSDYSAFLIMLAQMKERFAIELYAYCLMPNHFHLLLKPHKAEDLSRGMQWFMTTHVRRYHRHYSTSGHVWQGRFKSFGIQDDDHCVTVARYVEGNPVRAGLVPSATDWCWSSHRERCGLEEDSMIAPLPVPFTGDWNEFVNTPMTPTEMAKARKLIIRQKSDRKAAGIVPPYN
jgi:putative transposase